MRRLSSSTVKVESKPSLRALIGGLRRVLRNWFWLGPLCFVVLPSRFPPRAGLLDRRIARKPVTLRLRSGIRFACTLGEFSGFLDAYVLREYEIPGLNWLSVRTVVDAGANVGAATLWLCERAPHAQVFALEPGRSAAEACRRNVQRNGFSDRVTVLNVALGDRPGTAFFHPGPASVNATVNPSPQGLDDYEVPVITLEQLMNDNELRSLDVLKLDCEGAEYDVLMNADTGLLHRIGAMVGEFHGFGGDEPPELGDRLRAAGFMSHFRPNAAEGIFTALRTDRLVGEP